MGPQDTASLAPTARAEAGQPQSWKRKQPDGKIPCSSLTINPGVTKTPKEKEKVKNGKQSP